MTESMLTTRLSSVNHGMRRERHDLLAEIDQRAQPVDERHDERKTRSERPVIAPSRSTTARRAAGRCAPCVRHRDHDDRDDQDDGSEAPCVAPFIRDERGGALNLDDLDLRARLGT